MQDASIKLEGIIDSCYELGSEKKKPITNRYTAKAEFNKFSKLRKKSKKIIRKTMRKLLKYVKNDLNIIRQRISTGQFVLDSKQEEILELTQKLYDQQQKMYDTKTHLIPERIVSLQQNHIRPIVRNKAGSHVWS